MKLQKKIAIWSGIISVFAFGVSALFTLLGHSFLSNICVGVFSSGFLVCVVSIVTYFSERDRELKRLSEKTFELMMSEVENSRNEGQIDIYEFRRSVESILRLCLVDIRNCVLSLSEMRHNSELYKTVEEIWEHARNLGAAYTNDYRMILQYIGKTVSKNDIVRYKFEAMSENAEENREKLRRALDRLNMYIRDGKAEKPVSNGDKNTN